MTRSPHQNAAVALPREVDCVVVGGGPVGLLTAILLGRDGLRVAVVERWPQRYPLPRACTIDHEAIRILQAAGFMTEYSHLFEPSQGERGGYEFRNGEGDLLQTIDWNRAAESGWANTNGFHQPDLEAALEDLATATAGVSVHRGWTFHDLDQHHDGVTIGLTCTDQRTEVVQVETRWVVGADGANSAVRSHLGIGVQDSGFEADWLVVDYQPLVDENWTAFVTQYCDPAQPATAVNSGPGRRRFEFMRRQDVTADELGQESTAWRLMAPWGVTPDTARLERHAVYTFKGHCVRSWREGNVFLAGDAAHVMPPFLGQGLCSGLRDARALSWRLNLVHHGLATPAVLDTYGPERTGHVCEIIDEAVAAGRVICELDVERAAARDAHMKLRTQDPGAATREPPHPRLGQPSLTVPSAGNDGRLAPQGRIRVGELAGLFDDVMGGEWQLLSVVGDPAELCTPDDLSWFRRIGGVVADVSGQGHIEDVDGHYTRWFDTHGCQAILARPDFYVFAAGAHTDVPHFLTRLRHALDPATPSGE
ncbi:bifunctional 3-(3-hydroxy-phenyl)propionate/3-hydroxycinnamic acid hydroxylase [Umezawaea sp. Da 62-37]|uniref:bifunctional 3-(3-hydroxy-phenyl)propionate/3-hydroxycinnamic acid hydroxylase n=1 Tax=Umezawaea sp. Da 62-37 TaxID=3075927 RepID=UPI0028F6C34C|nr:bifunctional 3-(3-hydroxy-phenyl)propionate/3-hydroxycinnamic acid hydroxylase [Umezawaea sp. Da 62-37]WNV82967.1 bifunctional 3-(3-hydroxy-phenyl)propionate/3-hydroxycinnamic acid hydroxylase [Umezawaea sp. Da 62-37]